MAAIVDVAAIKIRPDLSGFRTELRTEVAKIADEVTIPVNLDVDTASARATLEEFRAWQERQKIEQKVDVDTSTLGRVGRVLGNITSLFGTGTRGALSFAATFTRVGSTVLAGAGALSAAGSAIGALAPLLAQASGAALLLPGAMAGAIATLAAIKLGADGAKAAFERLNPTVDALKSKVSDAFEASLIPAVNNLKAILPALSGNLAAIAARVGDVATNVTAAFKTPAGLSTLNTILDLTAVIVQRVGAAVRPLAVAFANVAKIGLEAIAPMTQGLGAAAQRMAAFTSSAEGAAKIRGWIQGAFTAISQLVEIFKTLGSIVAGVFSGISAGAGGLGASFAPALETVNQFVHSVQGMQALKAIGATVAQLGSAFSTVLGVALRAVTPLITALAPIIQDIGATFAATLVPFVRVAGQLLLQLVPVVNALVPAFTGVAGLLQQVAPLLGELLSAAIAAVLPIVRALTAAFLPLLPPIQQLVTALVPPLSGLLGQLGPIIAGLAPLIGTVLATAIRIAAQVLPPLVSAARAFLPPIMQLVHALLPPVTQLLTALAPVVVRLAGFVIQLVRAVAPLLPPITSLISALLPPLVRIITSALRPVMALADALIGPLVGATRSVVDAIGTVIRVVGKIVSGLVDAASRVYEWFSGLGGRIFGAIGDLAGQFVQFGADLLKGLAKGIAGAVEGVIDTVKNVAGSIVDGITGFFGIGSPSRLMAKDVGRWIPAGIGAGIEKYAYLATNPLESLYSAMDPGAFAGITAAGPSYVANGVLELQAHGIESAVERGLSRAQFVLDSRGVATINMAGASLNTTR